MKLKIKRTIQIVIFILMSNQSYGQMIMSAEGISPKNVCKQNTIYFLISDRAKPNESIDSIEIRLNRLINFVKENPSFESKPSIQFAVNCKGEIGGGFHMVTESGNDELDKELIEFFENIISWKPGKIKNKAVDSWFMWRMEIKNGHIVLLN